jgi:hypothetical protein
LNILQKYNLSLYFTSKQNYTWPKSYSMWL